MYDELQLPPTTEVATDHMKADHMKARTSILQGWEIDQLFKLRERRPDLLEMVVQRLVQENEDIRWSVVIGAYLDKQISLGKAAESLGLTEIELRQRFHRAGSSPAHWACGPD